MDVFSSIGKDVVERLFEEKVLCRLMHKVHCVFSKRKERSAKANNLLY
jgi:hypothetical protein